MKIQILYLEIFSKKKIREQKFFKENLGEREPSRKYLKKMYEINKKIQEKNYKIKNFHIKNKKKLR